MGGAEQVGRATGAASGQVMGGCSAGMTPVVIAVGQESQSVGWDYRNFTAQQPGTERVLQGSRRGEAMPGPARGTPLKTAGAPTAVHPIKRPGPLHHRAER